VRTGFDAAALARLAGVDIVPADAVDVSYLSDWAIPMAGGAPLGLARPRSTDEVAALLRECHAHDVCVVPQGGRTGLTGGATAIDGALVLSLERMSGVEEVDTAAATLTARAGTPLQAIQEAAERHGMLFALDLGARGSCQIGGNVATNAGGNRVIRYGMTRDLVLGLEVVLADGTVLTSLNKLIKNNAGFDLRQIFIGSEGTLGVITRVVVRLHPQPLSQSTAMISVASYDDVLALLQRSRATLGPTLSAFEVMWPDFYALMTGKGATVRAPLPAGGGAYALVEAFGIDPDHDRAHFERMLGAAAERGEIVDAVVAASPAEARDLWKVRDSSSEFKRLGWPALGYDIGIPTRDIGRFVEVLGAALGERWPGTQTAFFGHIGDSNLHLHLKRTGGSDHDEHELVYGVVRTFGGTTSAEHGIGLLKRPYLSFGRTPAEIAMMRTLKRALDPKGILNPGKVLG
jgi:FAD/FMN-containing dehydrogenase